MIGNDLLVYWFYYLLSLCGKKWRITWRINMWFFDVCMWFFDVCMWFFGIYMWFFGWTSDSNHCTIWLLTFSIVSPYVEFFLWSYQSLPFDQSAGGVLGRFFPWVLVYKGLYFWAERIRISSSPVFSSTLSILHLQ